MSVNCVLDDALSIILRRFHSNHRLPFVLYYLQRIIEGTDFMNHNMKLNPDPFTAIETGKKNIELRLNDEKRQQIKVGDTITFSNTVNPEQKLFTKVTALHHAPSFAELFATIPLSVCGFDGAVSPEEAGNAMRQYYSEEAEMKYGALGIELVLSDQCEE